MPYGTPVESCYLSMTSKGASKGKAARICQHATGLSLRTGKPPKKKGKKK